MADKKPFIEMDEQEYNDLLLEKGHTTVQDIFNISFATTCVSFIKKIKESNKETFTKEELIEELEEFVNNAEEAR